MGILFGSVNMSPKEMNRRGNYVYMLSKAQRDLIYQMGQTQDDQKARQQIRKDVEKLDGILNRGNKEKNVKLELKEFAGAALRVAKGSFLKNYNEYDMIRSGDKYL